jgi:hypothetical protein
MLQALFPQDDGSGAAGQFILGVSVGGGYGVAHAIVLARKVDWWVSWTVATVSAYSISFVTSGFVTAYVLSMPGEALVTWTVYGGLAGGIGSFGQWIVLRQHAADAAYLILASVAGFALAYASRGSSNVVRELLDQSLDELSGIVFQFHALAILVSVVAPPIVIAVVMNWLINRPARD